MSGAPHENEGKEKPKLLIDRLHQIAKVWADQDNAAQGYEHPVNLDDIDDTADMLPVPEEVG